MDRDYVNDALLIDAKLDSINRVLQTQVKMNIVDCSFEKDGSGNYISGSLYTYKESDVPDDPLITWITGFFTDWTTKNNYTIVKSKTTSKEFYIHSKQ